jgi:hypothetical protein
MNTYKAGTKLFCDFHFSGKPDAVCIEVLKPGDGRRGDGLVRVKVTKDAGAYRAGEVLELSTFVAVPKAEVLPLKHGQYLTRVSTLYRWE